MLQRAAALGVIAASLVVFGVGVSRNLPGYGPALEEMTDGFRQLMSDDGLVAVQREMMALEAVTGEIPSVIAGLAEIYETDTKGLVASLSGDAPTFAAGLETLPATTARLAPVASALEAQQANFEAADGIPVASLAATSLSWLTFGISAGLALSGLVMLTRRPIGAWMAATLGLVVVASTTGAGLIPKAGDLDQMNAAFRPWYTAQFVSDAERSLAALVEMGREVGDGLFPALAGQLDVAAAEAEDYFAETYPATRTILRRLPDDISRLRATVASLAAGRSDYDTVAKTTLAPLAWTILLAGVVATVFGVIGAMNLLGRRESNRTSIRTATPPPAEPPPALDLPSVIPDDGPVAGA